MNQTQAQDLPQEFSKSVPTFGRNKSLLYEAGMCKHEQASDADADAFLFYSNDEVRMRKLSGGIIGASQEASSSTSTSTRKTRISFELDPLLHIHIRDSLGSNEDDLIETMVLQLQMKAISSNNTLNNRGENKLPTKAISSDGTKADPGEKLSAPPDFNGPTPPSQADVRFPRAA